MFIKPALCALMIGLIGVYISVEYTFLLKKIYTNGVECPGKIVGYKTEGEDGKIPLVEFTTIQGEIIKETPILYGSFSSINRIEQSFLVRYHPDDPKKFVFVKDSSSDFFSIFIVFIICLTFVVLSIGSLLSYIKIF